jgi:cystathionine beta-lyase/cystathionine gamma-synthase
MAQTNAKDGFGTRCVHAGIVPDATHGAVNPAIQLSTTFVQPAPAEPLTYDYIRAGNPTREALENAMAELEQGASGHVFSSGLSAMDACLRLLDSGDHVICADDAYGGSIRLLTSIATRQGIGVTFVDTRTAANVEAAMTPTTKLVIMETPTNPLLRISDISAIADIAHAGDALLVVDNTFMSPALQNPLPLGADIAFHSATKYLGGHSDVLAGVLVAKDPAIGEKITFLQLAVGAVAAPFDCYLMLRGLKTLDLRVGRQTESAGIIAQRLVEKFGSENVYYPGLATHEGHELHAAQSRGGGGMISVRLPDGEAAKKLVKGTRLFQLAESLGAVESLIQIPALMTHASVPQEMREANGLTDGLVRISVGVEDVEDLWRDITSAF